MGVESILFLSRALAMDLVKLGAACSLYTFVVLFGAWSFTGKWRNEHVNDPGKVHFEQVNHVGKQVTEQICSLDTYSGEAPPCYFGFSIMTNFWVVVCLTRLVPLAPWLATLVSDAIGGELKGNLQRLLF